MGKLDQARVLIQEPFGKDEFPNLGDQERIIAGKASRGFTNREIAEQMGITDELVAYYLRNVLLKLECKKRDLTKLVFDSLSEIVGGDG